MIARKACFKRTTARGGIQPGEQHETKELERENHELKRANEILRKASAYLAQAEFDRRPK